MVALHMLLSEVIMLIFNPSLPKSISYLPSLSTMYSSSTKYIHMQEGFAGGRLRATFEANARRQRKITAKGSLRCQGPPTNIPINPGRLEKLILRTDCVYIVNGRRDLNHDYGNASEPFPDVRHCVSCWEWGFRPLGLRLETVARLCGAVRATATGFDVIYSIPWFKVYSTRETLLQGIAAVARRSG